MNWVADFYHTSTRQAREARKRTENEAKKGERKTERERRTKGTECGADK